jgi:HlyD family secretion protein
MIVAGSIPASAEENTGKAETPIPVGDAGQRLLLVGDIEPQARVYVFPIVPGKVEQLNVEVGSAVQKGDVLVVIEHEELELGVRQARAILESAKASLEQAEALSKINVTSKAEQAQAGLSAARATYNQAKDLSLTQTTTQVAQADAVLEAARAALRKAKEGARKQERKQVEAALEQAKANLDNARSNYDRAKKLHEQGAISKQTYEGAETQFTVAEAQYKTAVQQLNLVQEGAREEDIEAAEAQVRQAEAALEMAKRMEDTKSWERDIALAEAQVKQAEALFKVASAAEKARTWEAEIRRAEMAVEQAKAGLDLAQKKLSDATITAPISGIISMKNTDLGGMATPQSPIFEIVDMDVVKAEVSIVESELYKIKVGYEALVSVDALQEPAKGKVTIISPTLDKITRTTTVEISIDNKDHRLRPGMFARAKLSGGF